MLHIMLIFFLGASIASFLKMYLDTDGKNLWVKRSRCDACGRSLGWWELLPVVSYLILLGKSKCCKSELTVNYLISEMGLGLWFLGSYLYFGFDSVFLLNNIYFILSLVIGCVFSILVMQDLDDMSVSSRYLYLLCAIGVLGALTTIYSGKNFEEIFTAIIVFSPFWLIYFLGKYLDKGMIGEADPYVFTALGIFFGTQFSISLFLYSVWLGAFLGVGYLHFVNKKFERNVRIPFLPIIFLACLIILLFNYHVIKISDILILRDVLFVK